MTPTRIGLDIAKNVFQAHGVDDNGTVVIRKRLRRPDILRFFASLPPCLIGIEACSASHHWARELIRLGHEVRLMPARYVKPYVQRGKSDALDAEAICEAVSRPTMRFATIKTTEQQAVLTLHRARDPGEAADHVGESDSRLPRRVRDRGAFGYQAGFRAGRRHQR